MSIEEIKKNLENAFHEMGHAHAAVGSTNYLAALFAVDRAIASAQQARDALDALQD